jgi:hypothetical protein
LLASTKKIYVPYFFTAEQLAIRTLAKLDPRLTKWSGCLVAALLRDWQVHQRSLSGMNAPPDGRGILDAAMDCRR